MSRKYGFELEFTNQRVGYNSIKAALIASVALNHPESRVIDSETFRAWTVKSEHCGMEITSPSIESSAESMDMIKNIVDGIRRSTRENGRIVGRDCGFHVHIDIGEFSLEQIRNLCRIFYNFEGVLFQFQPSSRRDNRYVRNIVEHGTDWIDNFDPDVYDDRRHESDFMFDHSSAVSFSRFVNRGTVEFRYAAGTTRGVKVMSWIRLLLTLVEIAKSYPETIAINRSESIEDLKDFIRENNTCCNWINNQKNRCCRWIDGRLEELRAGNERRAQRRATNRNRRR